MDHPTQLSWALAKDPVFPYRGPLSTSGIENLRDGPFSASSAAPSASRSAMMLVLANRGADFNRPDFASQGLRGKALDKAIYDQAARHIRLAALVEQPPDAANRITLDAVQKDIYGVPLPRIAYRIDQYTQDGMAEARKAHADIFTAAWGQRDPAQLPGAGRGTHHRTLRMARNPPDLGGGRGSAQPRPFQSLRAGLVGLSHLGHRQPTTLTIAALALRAVPTVKASLQG